MGGHRDDAANDCVERCGIRGIAFGGPCRFVLGRYRPDAGPHRCQGEAIAAAAPFVTPGIFAGSVQPTPFGMATVEEKMGEVSRNKVDAVRDAMARARAASVAGKYKACEKALADVRHLMAH